MTPATPSPTGHAPGSRATNAAVVTLAIYSFGFVAFMLAFSIIFVGPGLGGIGLMYGGFMFLGLLLSVSPQFVALALLLAVRRRGPERPRLLLMVIATILLLITSLWHHKLALVPTCLATIGTLQVVRRRRPSVSAP
jgi:hypothetical protein